MTASLRATRALIDLDALAANVRRFRQTIPTTVRMMAVVKANGYGHGAVMVARTALAAGATELAVATVQEGLALRGAGLTAPILILGPVAPSEIEGALTAGLTLAVDSGAAVERVVVAAARVPAGQPATVHLKIDTGMRRYGSLPAESVAIARMASTSPGVRLGGVFTHLACADEADEAPSTGQLHVFEACLARLAEAEIDPGLRHAANSAAAIRSRRYDYDLVRLGIALYGLNPSPDVPVPAGVRPVMSLCSRVARVIPLQLGDRVSYGGTYVSAEPETAALVPIGYADGYRRGLSNRGWMGIAGGRGEVRGRVCMDQTIVGVPRGSRIEADDEVVVFGAPGCGGPSVDDLADLLGTINYEIVTGISPRVPRLYVRGGRVVAVQDLLGLRSLP